jgi:hypothetical protein
MEEVKEKEFIIDDEYEYVIFLNEKKSLVILQRFNNELESLCEAL